MNDNCSFLQIIFLRIPLSIQLYNVKLMTEQILKGCFP